MSKLIARDKRVEMAAKYVSSFGDDPTPWYRRMYWRWRFRLEEWGLRELKRDARVIGQMVQHPRAFRKFVGFVRPWLKAWRASGFDPKWLEGYGSTPNRVRRYLLEAWSIARHGKRHMRIYLPVISNTFDAPCEGCGRCCRVPKGESGYVQVQVFPWERFRFVHPDIAVVHPERPNEYMFRFVDDGEGGKKCPMLAADGRCSAYGYRPTACVVFNCADGMSEFSEGMFSAGQFLRNVPKVKERLVQIGFKKVERYEVEDGLRRRRRDSQWPNSIPVFGSTTRASCEGSAAKPRRTASSTS